MHCTKSECLLLWICRRLSRLSSSALQQKVLSFTGVDSCDLQPVQLVIPDSNATTWQASPVQNSQKTAPDTSRR